MKKTITLILLAAVNLIAIAQEESTEDVSIDMLSAPQSPAASLMGFTDSEIIKPETPTDFMLSFQNESNNFTKIPSSFAADFRLGQFFNEENQTLENFLKLDDISNNIKQTFILSTGYKNYDALGDTTFSGQGMSVGFKFSIWRGDEVDSKFDTKLETLDSIQKLVTDEGMAELQEFKKDSIYLNLRQQIRDIRASSLSQELKDNMIDQIHDILRTWQSVWQENLNAKESIKSEYDAMHKIVEDMEFNTYGKVWDIAGGLVIDFPDNRFNYSTIYKGGLWTTFGYEGKKGLSLLGMGRGLYNPGTIYNNEQEQIDTADVFSIDIGGRLLYESKGKGLSLSAEFLLRSVPNSTIEPAYRTTFNLGYEIKKNTKLTFAFGRDFDGTISKDNNLIAALNLALGLGSSKKFETPKD